MLYKSIVLHGLSIVWFGQCLFLLLLVSKLMTCNVSGELSTHSGIFNGSCSLSLSLMRYFNCNGVVHEYLFVLIGHVLIN